MEPRQAILQTGTMLQGGKYRIEKVLGQGGFGITYLVYQNAFDAHLVVKEFFLNGFCTRVEGNTIQATQPAEFGKYKEKFLHEARMLFKLRGNRHIVEVTDFFEENGTAYLVMPYIADENLEQYTRKQPNNRLSVAEGLAYTLQIANALEIVHAQNILHRDLKPSNILRRANGEVVLIDFGAAREHISAEYSQTMSAIISAGYAPPEQYNVSAKRGPSSDVYSLAGTLYRLLTGKLPLDATSRTIEDFPTPKELNPAISDTVSDAIMKAMELKPTNRYQSVQEFVAALTKEEVETHTQIVTPPTQIITPTEETQIFSGNSHSHPSKPVSKPVQKEPVAQPKSQKVYGTEVEAAKPQSSNRKTWIFAGIGAVLLGLGTWKSGIFDKDKPKDPNDTIAQVVVDDTVDKAAIQKRKDDSIALANHKADSLKAIAMSGEQRNKLFEEEKKKGDAFFKKNDYPQAILAYQTASTYKPDDKYCPNQIKICKQKIAATATLPTVTSKPTTATPTPTVNTQPTTPQVVTGWIYNRSDDTGHPYDYYGKSVNGVPNDPNGKFAYKDGTVCIGNVVDGHLNGSCNCKYKSGDTFNGVAKRDRMNGFGTYRYANGAKYEGNFVNDQFQGHGKLYYANGEYIEGNFQNGNPVGTITAHYNDGRTEEGTWKNDQFVPNKKGPKVFHK